MGYKSIYSKKIRGGLVSIYDIYSTMEKSTGYLDIPMGSSVLKSILICTFKYNEKFEVGFIANNEYKNIVDCLYEIKEENTYIKIADVTEVVRISGEGEYIISPKNKDSLISWTLLTVYYNKYDNFKDVEIYFKNEEASCEDVIFNEVSNNGNENISLQIQSINKNACFEFDILNSNSESIKLPYSIKNFEIEQQKAVTTLCIIKESKATVSKYILNDLEETSFIPEVIIEETLQESYKNECMYEEETIEIQDTGEDGGVNIKERFKQYNEKVKEVEEVQCKYKIEEEKSIIRDQLKIEVENLRMKKAEIEEINNKIDELRILEQTKYLTTGDVIKIQESRSLVIVLKNKSIWDSEYTIEVIDRESSGEKNIKATKLLSYGEFSTYIISKLASVYEVRFRGVAENFNIIIGERLNHKNDELNKSVFVKERVINNVNKLKEIPLDIKEIEIFKNR